MRNVIKKLTLLTASLMLLAVPALADDGMMNPTMEPEQQQGGKNECLLVARNCANQVDSLQERISRIQNEISRGVSVYTNDELQRLQRQLDDANRDLSVIMQGGA
jgi:peptidoglycan hydrolase CwlO-like protein